MEYRVAVVFLVTIFASIIHANDINLCPHDIDVIDPISNVSVLIDPVPNTRLIRHVRLPTQGLYEREISCLFVTDNGKDGRGGNAELVAGGLKQRYAEVKLVSDFGYGLSYSIISYLEPKK